VLHDQTYRDSRGKDTGSPKVTENGGPSGEEKSRNTLPFQQKDISQVCKRIQAGVTSTAKQHQQRKDHKREGKKKRNMICVKVKTLARVLDSADLPRGRGV